MCFAGYIAASEADKEMPINTPRKSVPMNAKSHKNPSLLDTSTMQVQIICGFHNFKQF